MGFTGRISSKSLFGAALLLAAAGTLVCPGASRAATVRGGSSIVYKAAKNEQHKLAVYLSDGMYKFHEQLGVPMTASKSCAPGRYLGLSVIECPAAHVSSIKIKLGNGDDRVVVSAPAPRRGFLIDGGNGDDVMFGSNPPSVEIDELIRWKRYGDVLIGGAGNDTMVGHGAYDRFRGRAGNDKIWSAGDGFSDQVICGSGVDQATGDVATSKGMPNDALIQCEQPLAAMPGS